MNKEQFSIIILAAGKGTRMKSTQAKVLHEVFFAPMVHHVLYATQPLNPDTTVVIVGHQQHIVEKALSSFHVSFVAQKEQLGTGHAVLVASDVFDDSPGTVMILCGDTPLIRSKTLEKMLDYHLNQQRDLTLLTTEMQDPTNYGRIVTKSDGSIKQIVEQKDATSEQLEISEINGGIYCVDKHFLFSALKRVGTDNSQGEIYLTDIVQLAVNEGLSVGKYTVPDSVEVLGVNSRLELSHAQIELQTRRNHMLMAEGVTIYNPESVRISPCSNIQNDTVIEAGVTISDNCQIGKSCFLRQGSIVENSIIGNNVVIGSYSNISGQAISEGTKLPSHTVKLQ